MEKEAFFNLGKRKTKTIYVEDQPVNIRALSLVQREALSSIVEDSPARRVAWIVACGVTTLSEDDLDATLEMDGDVLQKISGEILRLTGLAPEAIDEAKNG